MFSKFVTEKLNRALRKGKKAILAVGLAATVLAAVACESPQSVEVEVTREVEATRNIEVTRQVEVTREVTITQQIEIPITREVEVTR